MLIEVADYNLSHHHMMEADTKHFKSDLLDDMFVPASTAVAVATSKFKPKPRIINQKYLPKGSNSDVSKGPSPSLDILDAADSKVPVERSSGPSLCADLPCSLASLDDDNRNFSLSGAIDPSSTGYLDSIISEPISVSSELDTTQSSHMTEVFAAKDKASHLSESLSSLQSDFAKAEKEPTTVQSSVESLEDFFSQSDLPAAKINGKFRPRPSLPVKDGKKNKLVSFILPDNCEEASVERQSELVTSNSIETNTSLGEVANDVNVDESSGLLPMCKRVEQVGPDGLNVSALNTSNVFSEPICNSDELASKFQTDLLDRTKSAETNSCNSPSIITFGSSDVDSLHVQSVAACGIKSLDSKGLGFLSDDLMESLSMNVPNHFFTNSSEDRACNGNSNDSIEQSLTDNDYIYHMEGEHKLDHGEEPNSEEHEPSSVQNDEVGKSSKSVGQRKRKLKSSIVDDMVSEDQISKGTNSGMDEDYVGDCYKSVDIPEKKNATRKSSSKKSFEKSDSTVQDPPKKRFPRGSCKSTQRRANKNFMDFPDDEVARRQLAIRDLIRLAGIKERNKKLTAVKSSLGDQSDEHEQNPDDDDSNNGVQLDGPKLNYHSYINRSRQTRWSKTDTELFYQAIRQFGTDFGMIQVLFPNRSREQVKAKFKNEQRKHPLQISDAVFHPSKDHSHFKKVIQHLEAVAAQNSSNDSIDPKQDDEAD